MKKFIRKNSELFRTAAQISDEISRGEFSKLWQRKSYSEALSHHFPSKWEWIGHDVENQLICDYPMNLGFGEVVSERLFNLLRQRYQNETSLHHELLINGHKYFWFSPPVVDEADSKSTAFNVYIAKPRYITMYSEDFVNLWKEYGFTGHEFAEANAQ